MPVAPRNPYKKFECSACGWSLSLPVRSDVLPVGPVCPRCHSQSVRMGLSVYGLAYEVLLQWQSVLFGKRR